MPVLLLARRLVSAFFANKRCSLTLLAVLSTAVYVLTFVSFWASPFLENRLQKTLVPTSNGSRNPAGITSEHNSFSDGPIENSLMNTPAVRDSRSNNPSCSPKRNIVFVKTHKCASSAIQNIFLRYADEHNLTVVLPVLSNTHYLSRLRPFSRQSVAKAPWKVFGYNIFCHHSIFNPEEVAAVMPRDSMYITILRDPVRLFESLYEYGELRTHYGLTIEEYALATMDPEQADVVRQRAFGNLGRNQMLFDLGLSQDQFDDRDGIEEYVRGLEKKFNLVMIAERVDESLILLKDLLCWKTEDMVTLMLNARKQSYRRNLTNQTVNILRGWNSGDQILYDHFLKKFDEQVERFGKERMGKELEQLRKLRRFWLDTCIDRNATGDNGDGARDSRFRMWSSKVINMQLKRDVHNATCENLIKPEIRYTNELRTKQIMRLLPRGGSLGKIGVGDAFPVMAQAKLMDIQSLNLSEAVKALANIYKHKVRTLTETL